MRGGVFAGELSESDAREQVMAEPPMDGRDLARVVTPEGVTRVGEGDLRIAALDTGIKTSIVRNFVDRGVALELCPASNVSLGVYRQASDVPLRTLVDAGATIALGADDPLLFGSRLAGQYATMRAAHDLDDATLARLAEMSFEASRAPSDVVAAARRDIAAWLA